MARDVNEFISEALKEGYGMEDVVGFMANHKNEDYRNWASNWVNTANSPEYKTGFADEQIGFEKGKEALKNQFEAKKKEATTTDVFGMNIPSVLTGPGAQLAGVALLGAGAGYGLSKLKDRSIKNPKVAEVVGDIVNETKINPAFNPDPTKSSPASMIEKVQQRVEAGRAAGIGQGSVPGSAAPTAAPAPVSAPVAPQPVAQAPVTATEAIATGQSPSKAIQMDVAQQLDATPAGAVAPESGVKKRAAKTTQTFKSPEKLPEGMTFRGDLGPGDNWLYNTYGAEGRKAILSAFNEGKPAVSYERAKELSQMVQQGRVGPVIPRDIAKERGIAPPETNYGKLGQAIKVAGAAGLGLTAAQMANAAQQARQGNYAPAGEFGFNLLGLLPGLGTAFNIGTYSPELGADEQKELAKRWRKGSSMPAQPTVD